MKQYLVRLDWYEYELLGVIRANTKIQALGNLLLGVIVNDKIEQTYNVGGDIPLFSYNEDESIRHQVAKYLKEQIIPKNVHFTCLEINSNTNAYVGDEFNREKRKYEDILISLPCY